MKKAWNYILPIVSAGIGVIIGGLVDWKKEDTLEDKKFEYRLIENALNAESLHDATKELNFLMDIGMIASVDTSILRQKVKESDLPILGNYLNGFAQGNMVGTLAGYYKRTKRLPANFEEFDRIGNFALHYQVLGKQNIRYVKAGENDFQLIFFGPDNIAKTEDDKVVTMKDLKINR